MSDKPRSSKEIFRDLRKLTAEPDVSRDRAALLHEVQVYQEELTVQNDALREMQATLEETRDRFIELYDFAPNGYVSLDRGGLIRQINLTGASWLGTSKEKLEGLPLLRFVHTGDQNTWTQFLRQCRDYRSGPVISAELRIKGDDNHRRVELLCKPRHLSSSEYFTAMIDVTEHRQLQFEREQAAQARAALAGRMISIQEDERIRIARDLHDNLGQLVTGLRLRLEAIAMAEKIDDHFRRRVEETQRLVDRLDRDLDFIAAELRPAMLDFDFVDAMREFVHEWSQTFDIAVNFHASAFSEVHLGKDAQTHVYRITQEALNNVHKHAKAKQVSVILERRRDSLVLLIKDDGRGFEYVGSEGNERRGLGLISMRERAALIGGTIEVESEPGKGTTVIVTLPGAFDPSRRDPRPANR